MNFKRAGLAFFVLLLIAVYFFNHSPIEWRGQDSFVLRPIGNYGYSFESEIHLYNPNVLSSTIKSIHEDFSVNGIKLGTLDFENSQGIPGRKEATFPVSVRFSQEDYNRISLNDKGQGKLELKGNINYQNVFGEGNLSINYDTLLNIAALKQ